MLASVCQFANRTSYHTEKLVLPYSIKLINFLVPYYTEEGQVCDEVLWSLWIFLGYCPLRLSHSLSVIFTIFIPWFFWHHFLLFKQRLKKWNTTYWREYIWSREDFIEMLKLLPSLKPVRVWNLGTIDFCNIREPVDNESPNQGSISDFIIINRQTI